MSDLKNWNVRAHKVGGAVDIGQVRESNESTARCAALHAFGVSEEDLSLMNKNQRLQARQNSLLPDDDFDVSLALN